MDMTTKTKLVWITPDAEKHIAYCARVSSKHQDNPDYEKLLRYCLREGHVSVFEMASMCVEIATSRTIARQILRHRSFSFQEFSQRYAEVDEEPIYTGARAQDQKNRQASHDTMSDEEKVLWELSQDYIWESAMRLYKQALEKGIAKEVARTILPEGMTTSKMYMTGTLRSWLHYLKVRQGNGTQLEHVQIANEIAEIVKQHCPTLGLLLGE